MSETQLITNSDNEENDENQTALVPIEQREIDFYGEEIVAVMIKEEGKFRVYVPMRPLCNYLGLNWSAQRQRIERHKKMSKGYKLFEVNTPNGGIQKTKCLRLDMLPGWLLTIDANRVREELQAKIELYQDECFEILWEAFQAKQYNSTLITSVDPATLALEKVVATGEALVQLGKQQIELQKRVNTQEDRLNQAARVVGNIQKRLEAVEGELTPTHLVTEAQAEQLSTRVKALAEFIMSHNSKAKAPYGKIFSELYRRYGVSDYHHIQRGQFETVMGFLNDWREVVGGGRLADQLPLLGDFDEI